MTDKIEEDLHKQIRKICAPLFLGDIGGTNHTEKTDNATLTFVKFNEQYHLCTCKHVIDTADKKNMCPQIWGEHKNWTFSVHINDDKNWENNKILSSFKKVSGVDIAILTIHLEEIQELIDEKELDFIDLDNFITPEYSQITMLHAFGWLNEHKEHCDNYLVTKLAGSRVEVTSTLDPCSEKFFLCSTLPEEHHLFFSGMSGGPVIYHDRENNVFYPVGIVFEGTPGSHLIEKNDESFFSGKDVVYSCLTLTPEIFSYWLNNALGEWEKPKYKNYSKNFYIDTFSHQNNVTRCTASKLQLF